VCVFGASRQICNSGANTHVGKCDGKLACFAARSARNILLITDIKVRYENIVCGLSDAFYADGKARNVIGGKLILIYLFGFLARQCIKKGSDFINY